MTATLAEVATRRPGRRPGYVKLPDDPGRFRLAALSYLPEQGIAGPYAAAPFVLALFGGDRLQIELNAGGEVSRVGIARSARSDGADAKGISDHLARRLAEITSRGDDTERKWLRNSKLEFFECCCAIVTADRRRLERAVTWLGMIDAAWPQNVDRVMARLAGAQVTTVAHRSFAPRAESLLRSLITGARKLKGPG
jgi:hypothetical protein